MDPIPSYSVTPNTKPYNYRTYRQIIRSWVESNSNREAFVGYGLNGRRSVLTCEELELKATHFGKYLLSIGLQRGDSVLLCMGNSCNLLITLFGITFAGGVCVNYSPRTEDGSDVIDMVKGHAVSIIITDVSNGNIKAVANLAKEKQDMKVAQIIYNYLDDVNTDEIKDTVANLSDILEFESLNFNGLELPYLCADDMLLYFQSSGSTGLPKLIGHSHFSYHNSTYGINDVMQVDQSSTFYCDRPLTWGVGSPRTFIAAGSTRVFSETRWAMQAGNIESVCAIISKEKCTHVYLPAYQIVNLLDRPELAEHFKTVKCIKFAGERFKKQYTDMVRVGFCKRFVIWYGSTEAAGVSAFVSDDLDLYEDGIIGKPLEGVEMKIVNDDGQTVAKGDSGALLTRSVYRFLEYKSNPELFRTVVDSRGWLRTGDTAHLRDDGNFVMDGRFSEKISCGTYKFFPWDIEKFLLSISGVISAVGVPVPDKRLNNVLCACVIIDDSSGLKMEEIRNACETRFVEDSLDGVSYRPKYYVQLYSLPTSATGKLDRRALADKAVTMLSLA